MSARASSVLDVRINLGAAVAEAEGAGAFVRWVPLPGDVRGVYHQPTSTIYVREGMAESVAVPTILHETQHHLRGDDGPQRESVEARIDRAVACRLIAPGEYAEAERVAGHYSGAIAVELGLPRWVVRAYRETLRM